MSPTPTVFLDRDGVINRNRNDYVKSWAEFRFLPGACRAIAALTEAGYRVFVVSNQACVGRGISTLGAIEDIHQRMRAHIARAGGKIEAVLWCPHHPNDGCACRKPAPGLLLRARDDYRVDLAHAVFIGDSLCDMQTASAVGIPAILVLSGLGRATAWKLGPSGVSHVRIAINLSHAAQLLLTDQALSPRQQSAYWLNRAEPVLPSGEPRATFGRPGEDTVLPAGAAAYAPVPGDARLLAGGVAYEAG